MFKFFMKRMEKLTNKQIDKIIKFLAGVTILLFFLMVSPIIQDYLVKSILVILVMICLESALLLSLEKSYRE